MKLDFPLEHQNFEIANCLFFNVFRYEHYIRHQLATATTIITKKRW